MPQKVCLAYSGGLDTSVILKWLIEKNYEVYCFLADCGQGEDFEAAKAKALKIGAKEMVVKDCRKEFVDICYRAVQCNAIFEDRYLLGTSLARPVIAKAMCSYAIEADCNFVAHGCTGKGNDQVRFELAFLAIKPDIQIIAPWRIPEFFNTFQGRNDLIDYAEKSGIPVTSTKSKPYSMDANLQHCSYEAGLLEEVDATPPADMWTMTNDPLTAPANPAKFALEFKQGLPSKLTLATGKQITDSFELFLELNKIGKEHGIGRIDIVENRFIGLKSRGCYDAPAQTILRAAHLDIEGLTLDREVRSLRDQFVTHTWSKLLYNGAYFSPEREFVENSLIFCQKRVNGVVRMQVCRGNVQILGRSSETEKLYDSELASMDSLTNFSPVDTTGFININAIRLKAYGLQKIEAGEPLGGH